MQLFTSIIDLVANPSKLQRPECSGAPAISPLNVPMILLNLIDEIRCSSIEMTESILMHDKLNGNVEDFAVTEIIKHVHQDKKLVFENVGLNGELLEGYDGRHLVTSNCS